MIQMDASALALSAESMVPITLDVEFNSNSLKLNEVFKKLLNDASDQSSCSDHE